MARGRESLSRESSIFVKTIPAHIQVLQLAHKLFDIIIDRHHTNLILLYLAIEP
jgi:hypothetical protein